MPSPITTHILDTARGVPAADVETTLSFREKRGFSWQRLGTGRTNADGRISELLPEGTPLRPGLYRLTFQTGDYFAASGVSPIFFPQVMVEFAIPADDSRQSYHIPLLLSPFGYSTYRGS